VSAVLAVHIAAGGIGVASGAAALSVHKGARAHRVFGTVFFISMLTMTVLAADLSVLLHKGTLTGSVLTFYLVATAWATVRRTDAGVGPFEWGLFAVGASAAGIALTFGVEATNSPTGRFAGYPPPIYYSTAAVGVLASALDLKVILRGGICGAPRIARHLWRTCVALFFALSSFLVQGLAHVLPMAVLDSPFLLAPALIPLALMVFWLFRERSSRPHGGATAG
jgi:hypothetical protein